MKRLLAVLGIALLSIGLGHAQVVSPEAITLLFRVEADAAALNSTGKGEGNLSEGKTDIEGRLLVRPDHPNRVNCVLTTAATTSTLITGCSAPGAGLAIYITDVSVYGGVATAATAAATIQSGTGGACGTGTAINYYCQHVATAGCELRSSTPIRAVTNGEVCLLDATVGTKFVRVGGYIAP